jgi:hypothetical protein
MMMMRVIAALRGEGCVQAASELMTNGWWSEASLCV